MFSDEGKLRLFITFITSRLAPRFVVSSKGEGNDMRGIWNLRNKEKAIKRLIIYLTDHFSGSLCMTVEEKLKTMSGRVFNMHRYNTYDT